MCRAVVCAPLNAAACCHARKRRYFLRRLRRVKKANGQIVACNEVRSLSLLRAREGGRRLLLLRGC